LITAAEHLLHVATKAEPNVSQLLHAQYYFLWLLEVRKSIRPVKKLTDEVLAWLSVWSLERGASDLYMLQPMPLPPTHLLFHQNPGWFLPHTFLVLAYPSGSGKEAVKWVSVCLFVIT